MTSGRAADPHAPAGPGTHQTPGAAGAPGARPVPGAPGAAGPGPGDGGAEHGGRATAGAVALVTSGIVSVQFGGALAVWLMPRTGPLGVVTLRLVVAALVLLVVCRPRLRGHSRADWGTVIVFGIAIGGMNTLIYQSAARIPLGIAVTLEVLGPLALSVITSRRLVNVLWAALAVTGVFLLGGGDVSGLNAAGAAFALGAGTMWALYIVFSARTGRRFPQADGLALAMTVGAVLSLPLGVVSAGSRLLVPSTVGIAAAVAMLSSVLPYTLELIALRRLHAAAFAILMSVEPAVAALAGFLVLHQSLTLLDGLAIALVIAASMGAVRTRVGGAPPRESRTGHRQTTKKGNTT